MPDTRTVRDAADAPPTGHSTSILVFDGDNPILDALIGAQGRVVYTEEDVEAAGKAFWEQTRYLRVDKLNDVVWEELSPRRRIELCEEAQAILTAAGGVVAEEVRTFAGYEKASLKVTKPREVVGIPLKVHPGDILYIVRAKEE